MACRWYLAGASYFFIAFGTGLGNRVSALDLIFVLAAVVGVLTIFVLDPICYRVFEIRRKGENVNLSYLTRKGWRLYGYKVLQLLRVMLVIAFISLVYALANRVINQLGGYPPDTVKLKGEPFLFASLYCVVYWLTDKLILFVTRKC